MKYLIYSLILVLCYEPTVTRASTVSSTISISLTIQKSCAIVLDDVANNSKSSRSGSDYKSMSAKITINCTKKVPYSISIAPPIALNRSLSALINNNFTIDRASLEGLAQYKSIDAGFAINSTSVSNGNGVEGIGTGANQINTILISTQITAHKGDASDANVPVYVTF